MRIRHVATACAALAMLAGTAQVQAQPQATAPSEVREVLPADVVPSAYDLTISPDIDHLTFTGQVVATITVKAPVTAITLNAVGLDFRRAVLDGQAATGTSFDTAKGQATLRFARAIAPGTHRLTIDYAGKIGRETLGFFAMDYDTPAGKRRTLATNFEPSAARQLLPCWDQPDRKARFTVHVDAPKDRMAVSNMPVAATRSMSATTQRVSFQQSPPMATYLLFLGVGDWERAHKTIDGVDVGVVVKKGDLPKAAYALDEAGKLLHWYDEYFGVRFPLPKMDLIAAPGQINGGSMENWGAIFYSQNHLLYDPKTSDPAEKQLVFLVVGHEMAHQWFGDLVTMQWWNDLWLNEGFARWMQTYVADALHPEWETGLQAQSIFEGGKMADSLPSTHPVVQTITTAAQAGQAFDEITYDKGAAVITMLVHYIGDGPFRDGVRRYMKAHAYGNTVDSDLWSIMQQVAGKPILEIERDFTRQEGLPLLDVTNAGAQLGIAQKRFRLSGDTATTTTWKMPLPIAAAGDPATMALIDGSQTVAKPAGTPAIVNAGQVAYARVRYPQPMFDALTARMGTLAPVDQIGVMNDAFALGIAGVAPAGNMLSAVAALPANADPIVWQRAVSRLLMIDARYRGHPGQAAFRRWARSVIAPVATRLGTAPRSGESAADANLRTDLQAALGTLGDPAVISQARQIVASGSGDPATQDAALSIVAAKADTATFDRLLAKARATTDPLEKTKIYDALAGVEDPTLARRMIDVILGGEMPAGTNSGALFALASAHPDLAWDVAVPRLGEKSAAIEQGTQWRLAGAIAGMSGDPARAAALDRYVAANVPADARRPFAGAKASIAAVQRVTQTVLPQLDRWIAAHPRP